MTAAQYATIHGELLGIIYTLICLTVICLIGALASLWK